MTEPGPIAKLIDRFAGDGYAIAEDFLPASLIDRLRAEEKSLFALGQGRQAAIGRGSMRQVDTAVRGDEILWLDPNRLSPAQSLYWQAIDHLRLQLNRECFLSLTDYECHFARYRRGHAYQRHHDVFQQNSNRLISCVLYLNTAWERSHGGELRLYLQKDNGETAVDIPPVGGRLVILNSREIAHEVLPARRCRYSLAGWLKSR
jgi:SM-20-related protein